jgi:hypothetical protein
MSEWLNCASCGLKHRRREDDRCPKCGADLLVGEAAQFGQAEGALAMPAYPMELTVGEDAPEITLGQKLGAAGLAVNALLVIAERALFSDQMASTPVPAPWLAAIIDFTVAGAILTGKRNAVALAIARLVLGALVLSIAQYSLYGFFGVIAQLSLSVGALLLLVGDARSVRLAIGGLLLAGYLSVSLLGIYALKTGGIPMGLAHLVRTDLEGEALAEVRDDDAGWRMDWPGIDWRSRKGESIRKDNPLATRWLVQPRYDAHLMVIAETLPPGTRAVSVKDLERVVERNLRAGSTRFELLESESMGPGRQLLHLRAEVNSIPLEYLIGLFVTDGMVVQVHGFSHEKNFQEISAELQQSIESFTLL